MTELHDLLTRRDVLIERIRAAAEMALAEAYRDLAQAWGENARLREELRRTQCVDR